MSVDVPIETVINRGRQLCESAEPHVFHDAMDGACRTHRAEAQRQLADVVEERQSGPRG